jgi:spore maturation protein CgeB
VEQFFEPGREILVASSADAIVSYLREVTPELAREIGSAMRKRALQHHTYQLRARQVDEILRNTTPETASAPLLVAR